MYDFCGPAAGMVTPKGSMSTQRETVQVSVLPYSYSICPYAVSVLVVVQPSSEVFAFITRVEFVYEAFRLHYRLWEKRGITEQREIIYIYVCGRSKSILFFFFFFQMVFLQLN
jgi:hypothetical protein